jgi:hypothetical protein
MLSVEKLRKQHSSVVEENKAMKLSLSRATLLLALAGWTFAVPTGLVHGQMASSGASNAAGSGGLAIGQSSGSAFNPAQNNAIGQSRGSQLGLQAQNNAIGQSRGTQFGLQQSRGAQRLTSQQLAAQQLRARQLQAQRATSGAANFGTSADGDGFTEFNTQNQDPIEARSGRVNRNVQRANRNQDPDQARSGRTNESNLDHTRNQDPVEARSGRTNDGALRQSMNQDPFQARSGRSNGNVNPSDQGMDQNTDQDARAATSQRIQQYEQAAAAAQLGPSNRNRDTRASNDGRNQAFAQAHNDFRNNRFDRRLDNRVDPRSGDRVDRRLDNRFDPRLDSRMNQSTGFNQPPAGQVWALDDVDAWDVNLPPGGVDFRGTGQIGYGGTTPQPNTGYFARGSAQASGAVGRAPAPRANAAVGLSQRVDQLPDNLPASRQDMYTSGVENRIDDRRFTGVGRGLDLAPPPAVRRYSSGYRGMDRATNQLDANQDRFENRTGRLNRGLGTAIDRTTGTLDRRTQRYDEQINNRFNGLYDRGYDNRLDERRRGIDSENAYE